MIKENAENAPSGETSQPTRYYLMKAEPDSRIVKEKDVKFSVDDFEAAKTTAWEGVRNYAARNIMQSMKAGEKVLFYHSNTKEPGIAGFAEVSREAYPDHTAWDKDHPYYDPKSDSSSPRWYMVDLQFTSRTPQFISLALLKHLATLSTPPSELPYLTGDDLKAIKNMDLLTRGRLSVQNVEEGAWDAINKIANNGYEGLELGRSTKGREKTSKAKKEGEDEEAADLSDEDGEKPKGKRKATGDAQAAGGGGRRTSKRKKAKI